MEDDILQLFLEDTREHLADIETDLLDIEEAGPDFDLELVNKVFRTAHSIKGSAGFLALDTVRDLSHKIENVLDMVRTRQMEPTSQVINTILRAFDRLRELVDNVQESGTMDILGHVAALTGLVTAHLPQEERGAVTSAKTMALPDGRAVFNVIEHDLRQARKGGAYIYLVEYDLIHDVHKKGKTPLELMRFLEKSGLILDCRTDLLAVGDLSDPPSSRIPFYILYASILEPELVKAIFQVEAKYIHNIEEDAPGAVESVAPVAPAPAFTPEVKVSLGGEAVTDAVVDALELEFDRAMAALDGKEDEAAKVFIDVPVKTPAQASAPGPTVAAAPTPAAARAAVPAAASAQAPTPAAKGLALDLSENAEAELREEFDGYVLSGEAGKGVLTLSGEVTVDRAESLKTALLRAFSLYGSVTFDLCAVEAADLSFLQLMWSAALTAKARGITLNCKEDPSPVVAATARRAGFDLSSPGQYGLEHFPLR